MKPEEFISYVDKVPLTGGQRDIEERLLPLPSYYREIRKEHTGLSAFDIERSILRNWDRPYDEPSKHGDPWHKHLARFAKLLIHSTVITPWFLDECLALEITLSNDRDLLNLIGSKSSGKSSFMARIALTLLGIDPEYTLIYAAAPYKNVADYTIWGELETCFLEIKQTHGEVYNAMRRVPSGNKCYFTERYPKTGRAELVGLDQAARLQGAKSFNPDRGFLVVLADEIGVFPSQAFVEILANITANKNFVGITGCNFKSINGMEGLLCNPEAGEFTALDIDKDHIWKSDYNSITLRLDGHLCPNII